MIRSIWNFIAYKTLADDLEDMVDSVMDEALGTSSLHSQIHELHTSLVRRGYLNKAKDRGDIYYSKWYIGLKKKYRVVLNFHMFSGNADVIVQQAIISRTFVHPARYRTLFHLEDISLDDAKTHLDLLIQDPDSWRMEQLL